MPSDALLELLMKVEEVFDPTAGLSSAPPAGAFGRKSYDGATIVRDTERYALIHTLFRAACAIRETATTLDAQGNETSVVFRATPSAGALFPYELFWTSAGQPSLGVLHFDANREELTRIHVSTECGHLAWIENRVFVVQIPTKGHWKYGDYAEILTIVDSGYQIGNLYRVAATLGLRPVLELAVEGHPAARALGLAEGVERLGGCLRLASSVRASLERPVEACGRLPLDPRPYRSSELLRPLAFAFASPEPSRASSWTEATFSLERLAARRSVRAFAEVPVAPATVRRVLERVRDVYEAIASEPRLPTRLAIVAFPAHGGRLDVDAGTKLDLATGTLAPWNDRASRSLVDFSADQEPLRTCRVLFMLVVPTEDLPASPTTPADVSVHAILLASGILGSILQMALMAEGVASCPIGSFLNREARRFAFFTKNWVTHQVAAGG